jgi:transposase
MKSITNSVGIDVHKSNFRVSINQEKPFKVDNCVEGIACIVPMIPEGAVVHVEASGGYERLLRHTLKENGIACKLHNPRKIDRLADPLGRPAKTDDLDALHLCEAGPLVKGFQDKSADQEKLCDLSRTIESFKDSRSEFKRQAQKPGLPSDCIKAFATSVQQMDKAIKKLEKTLLLAIQKSKYKEQYELALSVTCIGSITAATLVSELPVNLYEATPQQLVAYGGLAPKDDSSGKRNGPKHLAPGNMHIKHAMYMPAMAAIATQQWAKSLYARLKARGRCHQQAIAAIMRKLLERVVVVIKRGTAYEAVRPKNLQVQNEP